MISEENEKQLSENIQSISSYQKYKGKCYNTSKECYEQAHHQQMSFGKYHAYEVLHEYDETVTVEECKDMTMRELNDKIEQCKKEHGEDHE